MACSYEPNSALPYNSHDLRHAFFSLHRHQTQQIPRDAKTFWRERQTFCKLYKLDRAFREYVQKNEPKVISSKRLSKGSALKRYKTMKGHIKEGGVFEPSAIIPFNLDDLYYVFMHNSKFRNDHMFAKKLFQSGDPEKMVKLRQFLTVLLQKHSDYQVDLFTNGRPLAGLGPGQTAQKHFKQSGQRFRPRMAQYSQGKSFTSADFDQQRLSQQAASNYFPELTLRDYKNNDNYDVVKLYRKDIRNLANSARIPSDMSINIRTTPEKAEDNLTRFQAHFHEYSNKFESLVDEIEKVDASDQQKYGKKFKHVIYTDIINKNNSPKTPGTETIAAVLLASGFHAAKFKEIPKPQGPKPQGPKDKYKFQIVYPRKADQKERLTFITLSSGKLQGPFFFEGNPDVSKKESKPWREGMLKAAKDAFNLRPDNMASVESAQSYQQSASSRSYQSSGRRIFSQQRPYSQQQQSQGGGPSPSNLYGENIRFMLIDGGYKEGVSLKDVRHLWILEPPKSKAALDQVIGRVTRFCGSKALPDKLENRLTGKVERGWNVYIHMLASVMPVIDSKKRITQQKLYSLEISQRERNDAVTDQTIMDFCKQNSVDLFLNQNVQPTTQAAKEKDPVYLFAKEFNIP